MKRYAFIAALATLALTACTDAEVARFSALGDRGTISCYSGGTLIYSGTSTGKISAEEGSDGWFLKDAKTGNLVRVSGDCVIQN